MHTINPKAFAVYPHNIWASD